MSKSLGNIINVKDLLKTWDAEVLRMFFAQAHYRSPPDFSEKTLTDIEKGRERLHRIKERLQTHAGNSPHTNHPLPLQNDNEKQYLTTINELQTEFEQAMDDDINTPKAFASLFEFVNKSNRFFEQNPSPTPALCSHALDIYLRIGSVLTLFQPPQATKTDEDPELLKKLDILLRSCNATVKTLTVETLMQALLTAREDARKKKDWDTADRIRKNLEELGFEIQDTATGPTWRMK
jgi:cysteinyl-tRNA synthetase